MENATQAPPMLSPGIKITMYSFLLLWSLVGNVLVIAVVFANASLRTRFNCLIVNMAFSDLAIPLMALPQQIVLEARGRPNEWLVGGTFGNVLCKLFYFIVDISPAISIFSLVVVAVNRFIAIAYPMRVKPFSKKKVFGLLAFTWITSMVIISPHLYTFRVSHNSQYWVCTSSFEPLDNLISEKIFLSTFVIALFIFPLFTISVLYTLLIYKVYKMSGEVQGMMDNQQVCLRQRRNKQIFYISLVVVLAFALLWGPYFGLIFVLVFVWKYPAIPLLIQPQMPTIFFAVFILGYSNSAVNPCLYFLLMKSFRQGFKKLFRRKKTKVKNPLLRLNTIKTSHNYTNHHTNHTRL